MRVRGVTRMTPRITFPERVGGRPPLRDGKKIVAFPRYLEAVNVPEKMVTGPLRHV